MPRDRFQMLFRRRHLYRSVFATPEGKAVLADLLRFCHIGQLTYVPGNFDNSAFNEGKRRVGLRIGGILNMPDDKLMELANQQTEAEDGEST